MSKRLGADVFILGSIKRSGSLTRIAAQLISSESGEVFKSVQCESTNMEEKIFQNVDSISWMIKNSLVVSELEKEHSSSTRAVVSTYSPGAYRHFMLGINSFYHQDYNAALDYFFRALEIDSNPLQRLCFSFLFLTETLEYMIKRRSGL
ncbi:MAG: hypothetical protein U5L72_10960 [Bacteroidales bacterium]|nr:hypothetical protein [Bacteroidales bacterium]